MIYMKGQTNITLEDKPARSEGIQLTGRSRGQLPVVPERIEQLGQSKNNAQSWMCLVVKVKSDAVKNNIA